MKEFKHFLITRFNIVQKWYGTTDKNGKPNQTEEWLAERFRLFDTYCFPSVKNQSNTDFIWFVLFNNETPEFWKQKINSYQEEFPNFTPLYLEPYGDENELVKVNICRSPGTDVTNYIITSRLDNDDALHRDFIKTVQENFKRKDDMFLSFVNGLQYDVENRIIYPMHCKNNHYVSRIECTVPQILTVLCNHTEINEYAEVSYIKNKKPLWIEVIHKGNVGNGLSGQNDGIYIFKYQFKKIFGINVCYSFRNYVRNRKTRAKRKLKHTFPVVFNWLKKILRKNE